MKQLLFIYLIGLLALTNRAVAAPGITVPADTVAGHGRMVRLLSEAMCTHLGNDHTTAFDKMTSPAARQMTQQLFVAAMQRDSVVFIALIIEGTKQGKTAQVVGQELGRDVIITLGHNCPAALPLIVRLSQTAEVQKLAADKIPAITEVEKKILQPLATRICAQLTAVDAKESFGKLPAARRNAIFTSLMQKEFVAGRPQLLRYYSAAQLNDPQRRGEIGQKIAGLMLNQNSCSGFMILVGLDEMSKQKPDSK